MLISTIQQCLQFLFSTAERLEKLSDRISYSNGNGKKGSDPYRWGKTFRNVKPILQVTICLPNG